MWEFLTTEWVSILLGIIGLIGSIITIYEFFFKKPPDKFDGDGSSESPYGAIPLTSPYYIERPPIEEECYRDILHANALLRIKAPRQMGKTSLLRRVLAKAEDNDYKTVYLTFQTADESVFSSLEIFLKWFCNRITKELNLSTHKIERYWDAELGCTTNCSDYLQNGILDRIDTKLVLGLDEIDSIFPHTTVAKGFLGLLRSWYETGKDGGVWQKLSLVMAHSREDYVDLSVHQSPFNVGTPVNIPVFNLQQAGELAQRYKLILPDEKLQQLYNLLDGHPFLLHLSFYQIVKHDLIDLDFILRTAATNEGIFAGYLRRYAEKLRQVNLAVVMKQVVTADEPIASKDNFELEAMGLVKHVGNKITPFCELYRSYFREIL